MWEIFLDTKPSVPQAGVRMVAEVFYISAGKIPTNLGSNKCTHFNFVGI